MHTRGTGATQGSGTIAPHAVAPHGFARLSVCIAARNEAGCIGRCIASVRRAFAACDGATLEVIVADGGSTDATADIARDLGAAVVASSGGGRGGAFVDAVTASSGDALLLLHADATLSENAIAALPRRWAVVCYAPRFDRRGPRWRALEAWCGLDSAWSTFGDAGIILRRECWDAVGGGPRWPLFDDVELLRRLRKRGLRVVKLRSARTTCDARRFDAAGFYAYLWTCFRLLLRYRLGGDVSELAAAYARGNPAS